MKLKIFIMIIIALVIFGFLNYYIGLRGWQILTSFKAGNYKTVYWMLFWTLAFSFVIARASSSFIPEFLTNGLTLIGDYWMAVMLYLFLCFGILDIIRVIARNAIFIPEAVRNNAVIGRYAGLCAVLAVIFLLVYGTWNAKHPVFTEYNVTVSKKAGNFSSLNIAMVSDLHLGPIMDRKRLQRMVDMINSLNPDIVLMAGDITDGDINPLAGQDMKSIFKELKPRLGVYAIPGNHDYMGTGIDEFTKYMNESGIKVLADSYIQIDNSFYLVGRNDVSGDRFSGKKREELTEILSGVNKSLPLILMDHQPSNIDNAKESGVDIMLSGHTHRGQLAPSQIITGMLFEIDWGFLKKDNLNVIVSSGFGTWGPPIRTGNHPEVVNINVQFQN